MDVQKALSAVDLTESAKQEMKYIHSITEKYQADSLNRGLEAFVESAALDIPRNQRLNAVCQTMAKQTAEKIGWSLNCVPEAEIEKYYLQSVDIGLNGAFFGPTHSN
jgi:hypothetical protein